MDGKEPLLRDEKNNQEICSKFVVATCTPHVETKMETIDLPVFDSVSEQEHWLYSLFLYPQELSTVVM
jgi:hypothetical protein